MPKDVTTPPPAEATSTTAADAHLGEVAVQSKDHRPLATVLGWTAFSLTLLPAMLTMFFGGFFGIAKPAWWDAVVKTPLMFSVASFGMGAWWLSRKKTRRGRLKVEDDTWQLLDGKSPLRIKVDDVALATRVPGSGVHFVRHNGTVDEVDAPDDLADNLVATFQKRAETARFATHFTTGTYQARWAFGAVLLLTMARKGLVAKMGLAPPASVIFFLLLFMAMSFLLKGLRPQQAEVGRDGVHIQRALSQIFIPFHAIRSTEIAASSDQHAVLTIACESGKTAKLTTSKQNTFGLSALQERIRLGIANSDEETSQRARAALLDRNDRRPDEWLQELRKLAAADTSYRKEKLSEDDLTAILAASTTTPEQRLGAACALRQLDAAKASAQIRVAAETCADPELRGALLRIADDEEDDAAIEEALLAIADPKRTERLAVS